MVAAGRVVLVCALVSGVCGVHDAAVPGAMAQGGAGTLNELRRENEALRQRVDQLEAELRSSRETVDLLRRQVEQLNREVRRVREAMEEDGVSSGGAEDGEAGGGGADGPRFAAVDPEAPLSSPAAMLAEMRSSYAEALSGNSFESDGELGRYIRDVKRWALGERRDLRGQAEWLIEVTAVLNDDPRSVEVEYRVIDGEVLLPFSERRYTMEFPSRVSRFFLREPERDLWVVRGVVRATPTVDVEREEVGFFDFPPFVGPFAEFGFDFDVDAISRWTGREEEAEGEGTERG